MARPIPRFSVLHAKERESIAAYYAFNIEYTEITPLW
jgi:hypothetical protein